MVKDRSEEMLRQRAIGPFGGRALPCSNTFGLTEERWQGFLSTMNLVSVIFGSLTKAEVLFLLENKKNAINPKGDSITALYCPNERRDEIIQILQEKFGKLTFGETRKGLPYIAVDNEKHVLIMGDEGSDLVMHWD